MNEDWIRKRRKSILRKVSQITIQCIESMTRGDWVAFEQQLGLRGKFLKMMNWVDQDCFNLKSSQVSLDPEENQLQSEIQNLETQLVRQIEASRDRCADQMVQLRKSKETISKFKSSWVSEAGDEVDSIL